MEGILQSVLAHALHELLVERHETVGIAACNPIEFRVALGKFGEFSVEYSNDRFRCGYSETYRPVACIYSAMASLYFTQASI